MRSEPIPDLWEGSTVLAIWAHPDDESYLGAGLMQLAGAAGANVVNVTATLGETGTADPPTSPPERLAHHRRRELATACRRLGVSHVEALGFADGGCELIDDRIGARRVASLLCRHRPAMVLTFGPDGVTGHADHRAVSRWVTDAVAQVDPDIALVHAVTTRAWTPAQIDALHDVSAFYPGYPCVDAEPEDRAIELSGDVLERKVAALYAHASQIGPVVERFGTDGFRSLAAREAYRPANVAGLAALDCLLGAVPSPVTPLALAA